MKKKKHNLIEIFAFTLAEVLITLGIIGVVAAMTIPSLMQNSQEKATVTKLKKVYSTLSGAYNMVVSEEGTPDTWGMDTTTYYSIPSSIIMINKIAPYLKMLKDCGTSTGCFPDVTYRLANNNPWDNINANGRPHVKLQDGILLTATYEVGNCNNTSGTTPILQNVCGQYDVDINGDNGPNQVGKDFFRFYLTKYGIIPVGTAAEQTGYPFGTNCKTAGFGCTAWVIYNENMDYLHCTGLSWSGQTTCN